MLVCTPCTVVLVEPFASRFILLGSCERLLDHPILGEWYALHFTILKMCVHEEYHLVLIFKDYLVSMWYVILMRNSNSIMSINHLVGFYLPLVKNKCFITLWGSNMLCAYYKPIKCVYLRLCHIVLIL
jgi:hypothetical protein